MLPPERPTRRHGASASIAGRESLKFCTARADETVSASELRDDRVQLLQLLLIVGRSSRPWLCTVQYVTGVERADGTRINVPAADRADRSGGDHGAWRTPAPTATTSGGTCFVDRCDTEGCADPRSADRARLALGSRLEPRTGPPPDTRARTDDGPADGRRRTATRFGVGTTGRTGCARR